ncbi:MAG: hypothetical protein HUJ95_05095 [Bacteroidales bacterium]|nr:hypothetical protein [Bacteroidales bacterium]
MKVFIKILTFVILPIVIVLLVCLNIQSVMAPVNFNKYKDQREAVGVQRLKDIRTLQVAFKGETGHYASTLDSLVDFYNNGKIKIEMRIGSADDSVAVANTARIKKRNPRITPAQMYEMYQKGENLVFSIETKLPVKDTLFNNRPNFVVDSLKYIPFSGGEPVQMQSTIKTVSGVKVPLFEACMPYKLLLKGLNNQLRINLDFSRTDTGRYPGLKVGSIDQPNNNAGNWE